jgi:hypothetical protein
MQTLSTDYSHQQLVDALLAQFVQLREDDVDGEMCSDEEYTSYLQQLTHSQLVYETGCDEEFLTINDFMYAFG